MISLKLSLVSVVIALNVFNGFCDINESFNQNKSHALNGSHLSNDSSLNTNPIRNNSSVTSMMSRIHITNGFILRTLFVAMVILTILTLICIIRVYLSRRSKRPKVSKEWSHPKYDSLPTAAINDSLKKNAFVLNDSEDEDFTIFNASHRLIK